jgi:LuxR family maltose regulon positive regulatory protein
VEIGPAELRFTAEESRHYLLELRGSGISPEDAAFLHERSEGWPAALQLAAIAFGDRPGGAERLRRFGGSIIEVADYLAAEVLERLPEDLREFLVETSILEAFCAELCEAVTGREGAADMIQRLARASLFVMPLDADGRWYRYHALFAEFLRQRLGESRAGSVPELRRRAAAWLAAHDRPDPALEHAHAAGDVALALEILDGCATRWLHEGRTTTLMRWAEALPAETLAERPALHFSLALAAVVSHRYALAQRLIEAIGDEPSRRRDLAMLGFNLVIWSDRLQDLREALSHAVSVLSPADGFAYSSMLNCVGYLGFLEGSAEMARSGLAAAKASPHHRDNEVVRTYSEGQAAMIHLVRGELRDAHEVAGAEFARLAAAGYRYGTSGAIIALVLADVLYERNEIAAARVLLDEHLDIAEDSCIPDLIVTGFLERSRIARLEGDARLADELAGRLHRTGERRGLARLAASALLEKARVALAEGRVETAAAHTEEAAAFGFWDLAPFPGTFGNDLENRDVGTRAPGALPRRGAGGDSRRGADRRRRGDGAAAPRAQAARAARAGAVAERDSAGRRCASCMRRWRPPRPRGSCASWPTSHGSWATCSSTSRARAMHAWPRSLAGSRPPAGRRSPRRVATSARPAPGACSARARAKSSRCSPTASPTRRSPASCRDRRRRSRRTCAASTKSSALIHGRKRLPSRAAAG